MGSRLFHSTVPVQSIPPFQSTESKHRMRELLLENLAEIGLDPEIFGLHSLRSGGATVAANAGVPDRLFKRHGRWRSENAKDGYVNDSLCSRLSVTRL